jgi:hypothetical protein
MPHSFDIEGTKERLLVLQHLCHGNRSFCKEFRIGRVIEEVLEYEWYEYYAFLKHSVSEHLINCAIKLRMLQDSVKADEQKVDFEKIDRQARKGLKIGKFLSGGNRLNLREACNKIIHATDARLEWCPLDSKTSTKENEPEFWTGMIFLYGTKGPTKWEIELNVPDFCVALFRLVRSLEEEVNWDSLYKYDE